MTLQEKLQDTKGLIKKDVHRR